jgi:hypothetical protein
MAVVRLLANDGSGRGLMTASLDPAGSVIGRGEGVDVALDDPSVSRQHARMRYKGPSIQIGCKKASG